MIFGVVIAVTRLQQILRVIAASDYLGNGAPISAVFIAPSGAGKSELICQTMPPSSRVLNDFTTASLLSVLNEPKPPKRLVVPDFNKVISHKATVANLTIAFLLALTAEGITEIPGLDGETKLQVKRVKDRGLTIALLTGMTPEMFHSRRGKWRETGFLRRLVPVYYTYSETTKAEIQQTIKDGIDAVVYTQSRLARTPRRKIRLASWIADRLEQMSRDIVASQLVWRSRNDNGDERLTRAHHFPFDIHKLLRTYARAHALAEGRGHVTREDLDATLDFAQFVRYDRPVEL